MALLDSEENELGFNICKEESFCYVLICGKSLAVEARIWDKKECAAEKNITKY